MSPDTPQTSINWLEAQYRRHKEIEDKWAADNIRTLLVERENIETALVKRLIEGSDKPVAWGYELATAISNFAYEMWVYILAESKPCVPEGSIRNLEELYTAGQLAAAVLRERNECARLCERERDLGLDDERSYNGVQMAEAIRARNTT